MSRDLQVGDVADFQFDGRDLDTNDPIPPFTGTGVVEIVSSYGAMIRYAADAHVWMPRKVWGSQVQRRTG